MAFQIAIKTLGINKYAKNDFMQALLAVHGELWPTSFSFQALQFNEKMLCTMRVHQQTFYIINYIIIICYIYDVVHFIKY